MDRFSALLRRKSVRWILASVVLGLVGWFFASTLTKNWTEVQEQNLKFSWLWVIAVLFFASAVPITGLLWGRIVRALDPVARISAVEAIAVQCASWLLKYIPGQVGSVANKVVWAKRKGVSRSLVLMSFVYENVYLQVVSVIPSVAILLVALGPELFGENFTILILPVLIVVPLALVLYRPVFRRIIAAPARKVLKKGIPPEYFLSSPQSIRFLVEFVGPRLLNGVGFVLLAVTVTDVDSSEWAVFAAAYVLAGALGILAFFVPSGLGVREAVIVLVLSQYVPTAEAIIVSLLARLLSTVGDAVVAAIYVVFRRTISKEYRP